MSRRTKSQAATLARTPAAAPPRTKLALWKKAIFSLLITGVFFVTLELVLAAAGVQPVLYGEDPYVGFTSRIALFVQERDDDGRTYMVTARNKQRWFNPQRFLKHKPPDSYRIFCVGGSTTYGRPYDDTTSFCGWLREYLGAADDSRQWEVINTGGISYASYRVAMLMEELIRYEPDLFIIYCGHNEFLERRTYAKLLETPPTVRWLGAILSGTRTYTAVRRLVHRRVEDPSPDHQERHRLPAEVTTKLENSIGPEAYTRDDEFRRKVLSHYRFNLVRMIQIAHAADARVVLVTPASNLRNCSPFKSQHRPELAQTDRQRCQALLDRGRKARAADQFDTALTALDDAAKIDDRHAELHYLRGRVLLELVRPAEAKAALLRALDEDVCPLRALSRMRKIISDVASEKNVPLVDFAALVENRSEHGIPGDNLFLDHVHPTIEGNRLLGLALLDEMIALRIARPVASWGQEVIQQLTERVESTLDHRAHAMALRKLATVLSWAGKFEDADQLALQAVARIPDDAHANYMAAMALNRRGELDKAAAHYQRALQILPDFIEALNNYGSLLVQQDKLEEAAKRFHQALRKDRDNAQSHNNLGVVLIKQDQLHEAAGHFQRALRIDPDYADAHFNFGDVLNRQGRLDDAVSHYQDALRINPGLAHAEYSLGGILARQGKLDQASAHFYQAIRINPDHAEAHNNLGAVLAQQGNVSQAVAHFQQALHIQPEYVDAQNNLRRAKALIETRVKEVP